MFIDWYVPGYKAGGPIRSVHNIVIALKEHFNFYILTSAYDLGDTEEYQDVKLNQWVDLDGVLVKYLDREHIKSSVIKNNVEEVNPDTIYVNGIFSRFFSILPIRIGRKQNIKTIVAPRGMLGEGALEVKSLKKNVFLKYTKISKIFENVIWHASTDLEANEIRSRIGDQAKIKVSINIPSPQTLEIQDILNSKKFDKIKLIYVGRISPKKNLHLLIDWIQDFEYQKPVVLDIWGDTNEVDYLNSLKELLRPTSKVEINFKGATSPLELPEIYSKSHYFILLTKHENYGHVIAESISNGCPVIVSDQTPWKNLSEKNIGWEIPIDKTQFLCTLKEAIEIDPIDYSKMAKSAHLFFKEKVFTEEIIETNKNLFEDE